MARHSKAANDIRDAEIKWYQKRKRKLALYASVWSVLRVILIYICALLILAGVVHTGWRKLNDYYLAAIDPENRDAVVFAVKPGSSLTSVAKQLETDGLVRSGTVFKYYADLMGMGQRIQSGTYSMNKAMSAADLLNMLIEGDGLSKTLRITIIPGWTVEDVADYLSGLRVIESKERFLELCTQGREFENIYFIRDLIEKSFGKSVKYLLEGYLSPNTYEIYTNADEKNLIERLLRQTEAVYLSSYEERAGQLGFSMHEVFTLASIIEREAKKDDFAKASAVFHSRLSKKMSLDSDATVKYVTGSTKMALDSKDLSVDSAYNTYRHQGLPAGPICNPSMDAVMAALYPDEEYLRSGYLYFCSTDPNSGKLHFSRTLEEHEAAVAMYRPLWEEFDRNRGNR